MLPSRLSSERETGLSGDSHILLVALSYNGGISELTVRCGFPKKRNFKFLETLQLKTVLTLVLEDYPEANLEWCQNQDIQFMVSLH